LYLFQDDVLSIVRFNIFDDMILQVFL